MSLGYLTVDHRASPGLTQEQAIRLGYHPMQVKEGALFEADTLTCAHCKTIVVLNPLRTRERHKCFRCNDYICDDCSAASVATGYNHCSFNELADKIINAAAKG